MASVKKKPRLSLDVTNERVENVFEKFSAATEIVEELKTSFEQIFESVSDSVVESVTITKCNADFGGGKYGQPFSKACVEIEQHDEKLFLFGSLFIPGFRVLQTYLNNPKLEPYERKHQLVLSRLLGFLLDKDNLMVLQLLDDSVTAKQECDVAIRLVEHLFSKLSASSYTSLPYTLDKHFPNKITMCQCGCKTNVAEYFGDTSIGNNAVWHGCLDVIVGSLPVSVIENDPVTSREERLVEVKVRPDLEHPYVTNQLVAQCIVYSFTQKKRHPEYQKYLIPLVGVNRTKLIFYFYDSQHDILLKSRVFSIFDKGTLNYDVILAVWLVVNYVYLSSGCTKEILNEAKRANFFGIAGEQLPVYQNELSIGGIDHCVIDLYPFIFFPKLKNLQKVKLFKDILREESEEDCAPMGTL